ncbi:MAG: response regulator transcription factor [Oscillospiraceae bacterium]|jgi:DNA-binding response OmpR family regulator|nr:response regulator transcription factor [Oscillospiraceae bacterium]
MNSKAKILLVEDDAIIASGLVYALEGEGYCVTHCADVKSAIEAANEQNFELAVLDMNLPDGTGFDVRKTLKDTAVIFLTVVDDEGNIVKALEGGAEDYITKPFRLRELLARIKVVLRRKSTGNDILTLGKVSIHTAEGKAFVGNEPLDLTALEYRLLLTFANNKGRVLSRTQILDGIWDNAGNFVEDNTLTVYIKRLREKLGDAAVIETVRGMGYKYGGQDVS